MFTNEKTVLVAGVTAAFSIATSAVVSWYLVTSHIEVAIESQPRLAIAGYERVRAGFQLNTTPEEMADAYEDMNLKIDRLKELGYMVLDERVIMTAPDHLYVPIKQVPIRPRSEPAYENSQTEQSGEIGK